jgi:flagellar M-ring protein FliF
LGVALGRAGAWLGALSRPARVLLLSTVTAAALLISFFAYKESHEADAVLFSQLEQDDAAAIVGKLKELKVPYKLTGGGSTIEVPESRVGDIRLELASAGMPRGGGIGFESFDKMRLGATDFEQRVLYRRALEGELSRTIGTLGVVQSVRVHLVLPEKSVFVSRAEPASASIVLKLRAGRSLGPSEVAGIVHLTAASVPGLGADRVALVTTDGQMLKKPRAGGDGSAGDSDEESGAQERQIEAQLEERARSMLEKLVGVGHVEVRATAEIDRGRVERTEDRYDPSKSVLRSEETSAERTGGGGDQTVAGVPGAESNLPGGSSPAATLLAALATTGDAGAPKSPAATKTAASDQPLRESHTRNFEIDHVNEKRVVGPGSLKRITIAVILDGVSHVEAGKETIVPREHAELDRVAALVRSAVGANEARGDVVTVDSVPFDVEKPRVDPLDAAPAPVALARWRPYLPAGIAASVLLVLAIGLGIRRLRRRPTSTDISEVLGAGPVVAQLQTSVPPVDVRARAIERAAADPATAALVLRAWLGTNDVETKVLVARS